MIPSGATIFERMNYIFLVIRYGHALKITVNIVHRVTTIIIYVGCKIRTNR